MANYCNFVLCFFTANCDFDKGTICSFENQPADFNWRINRGATPSVGTGPDMDISGKGTYTYIYFSNSLIIHEEKTKEMHN